MAISVTLTISNPRFFEAVKNHAEKLDGLNEQIGALGLSSGLNRLVNSYATGDNVHRTGRLANSLNAKKPGGGTEDTVFKLTKLGGTVGSNVPYAAVQNEGGTIIPKAGGKFLAIPIPLGLKRKQQNWPRDIDPDRSVLQFIPTGDGNAVLVDEDGKLGFGTGVLYALRQSVRIPKKDFLRWSADDISFIDEVIWRDFWADIDRMN